ncbi:MAG: 5'-3' exonuclease H3TH domain-containing protein [Pseudomonadota bacterium]|nr:5'-3' exonuclease H3TH domain-containing protein [Pseudomonadota bacterium]
MNAPLYLVDASIYIFQAHFSPATVAYATDGSDRSAFVGFARFLIRFLRQLRRRHDEVLVAVAFDQSLFSGFRHQLYPAYKSNRVLPDDNLALQLDACFHLCETLGVSAFGSRQFEADDIIGTLCIKAADEQPVTIVSRDKDLSQLLLRQQDRIWDFQSQTFRNRDDIQLRFGIWPEQFPCYLGLVGDSIDCIPGVPGLGPVAARHLLQAYSDLDVLYNELDSVASLGFRGARSCQQKLETHHEQAQLSRQLARIVCCHSEDCAEPFAAVKPEALLARGFDQPGFTDLLRSLAIDEKETQRLIRQLDGGVV